MSDQIETNGERAAYSRGWMRGKFDSVKNQWITNWVILISGTVIGFVIGSVF